MQINWQVIPCKALKLPNTENCVVFHEASCRRYMYLHKYLNHQSAAGLHGSSFHGLQGQGQRISSWKPHETCWSMTYDKNPANHQFCSSRGVWNLHIWSSSTKNKHNEDTPSQTKHCTCDWKGPSLTHEKGTKRAPNIQPASKPLSSRVRKKHRPLGLPSPHLAWPQALERLSATR